MLVSLGDLTIIQSILNPEAFTSLVCHFRLHTNCGDGMDGLQVSTGRADPNSFDDGPFRDLGMPVLTTLILRGWSVDPHAMAGDMHCLIKSWQCGPAIMSVPPATAARNHSSRLHLPCRTQGVIPHRSPLANHPNADARPAPQVASFIPREKISPAYGC